MAPDQDVFRRVGRGGAGNFVHAAAAQTAAKDDLEAQKQDADPVGAAPPGIGTGTGTGTSTGTAGAARRAGRGGAGNYVEAERLPSARETEEHLAGEVTAAVASSRKQKGSGARVAMGGRGGAGNWTVEDGAAAEDEKEEDAAAAESKVQELERKVKEAVDKGLRMPDKVHHHARDKGSTGSASR